MIAELIVINGPDAQRKFSLADGQCLIIGRGRKSNTLLGDQRVSRIHCVLEATCLTPSKNTRSPLFARARAVSESTVMFQEIMP
jgi:hypothetical protein